MTEFEREYELLLREGLKQSALRREYEQKVEKLRELPSELRAAGKSEEEIAQTMHRRRRELGRQYKEAAPPLVKEYIYAATAAKYGDPLGPDYMQLRLRKTCAEIIESAARPIGNLDERITVKGFREWYRRREKIETERADEYKTESGGTADEGKYGDA